MPLDLPHIAVALILIGLVVALARWVALTALLVACRALRAPTAYVVIARLISILIGFALPLGAVGILLLATGNVQTGPTIGAALSQFTEVTDRVLAALSGALSR